MEYKIATNRMELLKKKLSRIINKCKKYGNDFQFSTVRTEIENVSPDGKPPMYVSFTYINVNGTAKIDSWEFVATLEIHNTGNIIKRYNTEIEIPVKYETSENICEHCNSKRNRKNLYLIHNVETGEFKQVGGSCLASYTHGLSLSYVAAYMEALGIIEEEEEKEDECGGGYITPYYDIKELLHYANVIINKIGFRKTKDEDGFSNPMSTRNLVSCMFDRNPIDELNTHLLQCHSSVIFDQTDFDCDDSIYIETLISWYLESLDNSEFMHNIKTLLADKYVEYNNIGLIVCLPNCYNAAMENRKKKEQIKKQEAQYDYFGEVGQKYSNIPCHVTVIANYETIYGTTYIHKMTSDYGLFIWKTSKYFEDGDYLVNMTVKGHKEYKDQKQTEVTRCKLVKNKELESIA